MSEASIINLNSTTPETPAGSAPVKWQGDDETNPRNVSAYVESGTATAPGAWSANGDHGGNGSGPVNTGIQTIPVTTDPPADGDVLTFDLNGADPDTGIGGQLVWRTKPGTIPTVYVNSVSMSADLVVGINSSSDFEVNGV